VCFMLQPLHPLGKRLGYELNRRLCGSQSQSGCSGEEINHWLLLGIEKFLSCPACNIVILLTDYSGPLLWYILRFLCNSLISLFGCCFHSFDYHYV
jgi:hypothetical protein